jgi:Flp pilus assembly protein TadG
MSQHRFLLRRSHRHLDKILQRESTGQSVVLIALMMVVILAMAGLVIDGGTAYVNRRIMQDSADAAALAGARAFLVRTDNSAATEQSILASINSYASQNGSPTSVLAYFVNDSGVRIGQVGSVGGVPASSAMRPMGFAFPSAVTNDATGIQVVTNKTFPTFFLGVININLGSAGAQATVRTGKAGTPKGLMPISVPRCYVDKNARSSLCGSTSVDQTKLTYTILGAVDIKASGSDSYGGAINFDNRQYPLNTQISTCSNSGSDVQDAVDWINAGGYSGSCGPVSAGQFIDTFTGNKAGNLVSAFQNDYPVGSVIVTCVYTTGIIGNGTVQQPACIGFSAWKIMGYSANSMTAVFAGRYVVNGPIDDTAASWQKVYAMQMSQ